MKFTSMFFTTCALYFRSLLQKYTLLGEKQTYSPEIFGEIERLLSEFLAARGTELKSEFYIPSVADNLIKAGKMQLKMLTTNASWFGVTYREDRDKTVATLKALTEKGEYPEQLFA